MCGICCQLRFQRCQGADTPNNPSDCTLVSLLKARGPDNGSSFSTELHQSVKACFTGYTLHQQGVELVKQPHVDEFQNILLWNGEIYNSTEESDSGSDTLTLAGKLSLCQKDSHVCEVISQIKGPWALIYWQEKSKKLWFGRDKLGRRSLLWNIQELEGKVMSGLVLTSVAAHCSCSLHEIGASTVHEVPAEGLFCILFDDTDYNSHYLKIDRYPWLDNTVFQISTELQTDLCSNSLNFLNLEMSKFPVQVNDKRKITPPVNYILNNELPMTNIDSSNSKDVSNDFLFANVLKDSQFDYYVEKFSEKFGQAVKLRTNHQQFLCKNCFTTHGVECDHANVAILFSGGIDSTVIAAFADKFVRPNIPIDLINVAFGQKDKTSTLSNGKNKKNPPGPSKEPDISYSVPDRITGYSGLEELRLVFPNRTWNFIEVNVTKEELVTIREERIKHLIYPHNTVLDDSIGCALWFAARAKGLLSCEDGSKQPYVSPARVMLVGMGADEQLAGYSRHREKFRKESWDGLFNEVQLDIGRISHRNLGRDDRIISDHGREARFPYLDEDFMEFLCSVPMCYKADLNLQRGIGEKLLLRLLAYKLGLTKTASLPKRAIQFGSKIAKLEDRSENAKVICSRLSVKNKC